MKKTALITGANRGLGLALCEELLRQDYRVAAFCRHTSPELLKLDVSIVDSVDVADREKIQKAVKRFPFESLDLLINNAAIGLDDDWDNLDFDLVKNQFLINAMAPLYLTHALNSQLAPNAKIALVTSRMGSIEANCTGRSYAYRMSKAALNMVGKNLSLDLRARGIAVGIFSPGQVDTDMLRSLGIYSGRRAADVAHDLLGLIDALSLENSGVFWHIDGEILPW